MDSEDNPSAAVEDDIDIEDAVDGLEENEVPEERSFFSNPIETLLKYHPECILEYQELNDNNLLLKSVPPVDDVKHRSMPFLSIFEKTKILGMRTNQLAQGARPFITVPEYITDVQEIARLELDQRRLPIIIKRFMPDGTYEKFRLSDMMMI